MCPFVTINANSNIGDFVLCNIYSSIAHGCKVGEGSILSPYATLNGNSSCRRKNKMSQKKNKMSYFCDKLSFFQP